MAIGKGTAVRGVSFRESRPTKIICDDYETAEEVINEKIRQKDADRYFEDIGKAGDTGTNFEFVGTILNKESLLSKLLTNPRYDSVAPYKSILAWSDREDLWTEWREIYRDIDNVHRQVEAAAFFERNREEMLKGTDILWPEKESYYDLMVELEEIGRRAFMKEKQNDPQGADEPIFELFHWYRETTVEFNGKREPALQIESNGAIIPIRELESIGAMDPSTGQEKPKKGKLGDFTVIPSGFKDSKGRLFIHHDFTKRVPPTRYITEIFELNERFKYAKFAVETNLYRNLLLPNIILEQKRRIQEGKQTLKIPFYDVEQTENKHERIYRLEPKVNHGWILFNRALSREFMNMFADFPYADHDDAPDAVEILWNLCNNRYRPSAVSLEAMSGR
jgi:predicted phage terminase large subunit-like protein